MVDKSSLTLWDSGVRQVERGEMTDAVETFKSIKNPSSRITFNLACIYMRLGDLQEALRMFDQTIDKDNYLAAAYMQKGIVLHNLKRYPDSEKAFDKASKLLRGSVMDYAQLGFKYKLYLCEIVYNQAIALAKVNNISKAKELLETAARDKVEPKHDVIDHDKVLNDIQNAKMLGISDYALFQPDPKKVQNLNRDLTKKKAKVISAVDTSDKTTGFSPLQAPEIQFTSSSLPASPEPRRRKISPASLIASLLPQRQNNKSRSASDIPRAVSPSRGMKQRTRSNEEEIQHSSNTGLKHGPPPSKPAPRPPISDKIGQGQGVPKPSIQITRAESDDKETVDVAPPPRSRLMNNQSEAINSQGTRDPNSKPLPPVPKRSGPPKPDRLPSSNQMESRSRLNGSQSNGVHSYQVPSSKESNIKGLPPLPKRSPPSPKRQDDSSILKDANKRKPQTNAVSGDKHLPRKPKQPMIKVEMICHETHMEFIEKGSALELVKTKAGQQFGFKTDEFDLWYQPVNETDKKAVATDQQMMEVWREMEGKSLQLWIFGKQ